MYDFDNANLRYEQFSRGCSSFWEITFQNQIIILDSFHLAIQFLLESLDLFQLHRFQVSVQPELATFHVTSDIAVNENYVFVGWENPRDRAQP